MPAPDEWDGHLNALRGDDPTALDRFSRFLLKWATASLRRSGVVDAEDVAGQFAAQVITERLDQLREVGWPHAFYLLRRNLAWCMHDAHRRDHRLREREVRYSDLLRCWEDDLTELEQSQAIETPEELLLRREAAAEISRGPATPPKKYP